jgi:hypothetical protein
MKTTLHWNWNDHRGGIFVALGILGLACSGGSGNDNGMGGTIGAGTGGAGGGGGSTGAACHAAGTLQVTSSGATAYVIDGASNPDLTLCRGSTYVFAVNTPGHPFYINSVQGTGTTNAWSEGVTGNGATGADVTFTVPADAPATLYYNCSIHAAMTGTLHIVN